MADLTIAVSEAVCAKTLEVVVANFGFDVSDQADLGPFRVGYDGRLFLKGGSSSCAATARSGCVSWTRAGTSSISRWG
jgi:hypothetical protein